MTRSIIIIITLSLSGARGAAAQPTNKSEVAPSPYGYQKPEYDWYGWQILIADATSLAVMFAAIKADNDTALSAGVLGFTFAGPVIHFANGGAGRGFGSMAVRTALPALGIAAVEVSRPGMAFAAMAVGVGGAILVDVAMLARRETKPGTPVLRVGGVSASPVVIPSVTGDLSFGLSGRF